MLVLEILGVRLLAPYVGLTLETTTAIIGAALAGIAAGAAAGGLAADRVDGRRLLPVLLAAGGLLCIAAVPLVRAFGDAVRGTSAIAALAVAMMILFPPACVLSAVSPVVAKLRLHDLEHTGRVVGSLSAWATAGALVGTFGTGFVLVPLMPTSTAVFAIGGAAAGGGAARLPALRRRLARDRGGRASPARSCSPGWRMRSARRAMPRATTTARPSRPTRRAPAAAR